MPRTKKQQQATKIAAERVATILNDPQTPKFLRDVLADMVVSLSNETEANEFHPKVLTTLLEIGLQDAAEQGLRQHNGQFTREDETEVSHAEN